MLTTTPSPDQKLWKNLFLVFSVLIVIIMPLLSSQYGLSGDEWLQIEYGKDIYNYFFNGDKQALDYSQKSLQYQGIEFYGGLFDFYMDILHHWFPSIPLITLRHFFNALTGAGLMIMTGLFARRLTKSWISGLLALLFMVFSPRIFGESMNNPKDIPFAFGFITANYFLLAMLQDAPARVWRNAIGLGLGFALAFGVRPAGGPLLFVYFVAMTGLCFVFDKSIRGRLKENGSAGIKKAIIPMLVAFFGGAVIAYTAWPWGLQSPVSNLLESFKQMANIKIQLRVMFEGVYRYNNKQPWYYEFKWIMISSPLIIVILTFAYAGLIGKVKKSIGLGLALFLLFAAAFPPLYMIYKKSSVHDTWRHMFFIYPFWVLMATMSVHAITDLIKAEKMKLVPYAVAILGLLPAITWTFRSHPNQYVYFNESIGGLKGAFGYYDTDYYQNTGLQAANWIREHVKPIPGKKIAVFSNMNGFNYYFAKDTAWIVNAYGRWEDRHEKSYDYYIGFSRFRDPELLQKGKWPPKDAAHNIVIDGVPLCTILPRKSLDGVAASEAYKKDSLALAIAKYESFLKAEPYDEYAWLNYALAAARTNDVDRALPALEKVVDLAPNMPYNMLERTGGQLNIYGILAAMYNAKKQTAKAADYDQMGKDMMLRLQEEYLEAQEDQPAE